MTTVFTTITAPSLGDFVLYLMNAATIKLGYPDAKLNLGLLSMTKDQTTALSVYPYLDRLLEEDQCTPRFLLDCAWRTQPATAAALQAELGSMAITLPCWYLVNQSHVLERALLQVPDRHIEELDAALLEAGVDPNAWYVCLHTRDDGYRNGTDRVQPNTHPRSIRHIERYHRLVEHIIRKQGGQVVRLGDTVQQSFPALEGFVDLSVLPNSLLLQCYALSRARYFFGTDSGPLALGRGFNVPTVASNQVNVPEGVNYTALALPQNHLIATKHFELPNGDIVRDRVAFNAAVTTEGLWWPKTHALIELSEADLVRAADIMFLRTMHNPHRMPRELAVATARYEGLEYPTCLPTSFPLSFLSDELSCANIVHCSHMKPNRIARDPFIERLTPRLPNPDFDEQHLTQAQAWMACASDAISRRASPPAPAEHLRAFLIALLSVLTEDQLLQGEWRIAMHQQHLLRLLLNAPLIFGTNESRPLPESPLAGMQA
jgi:putative glycosyltransferase (TIGR04372 family)